MDRGKIVVAVILLVGIVPMILLLITNIVWTTKIKYVYHIELRPVEFNDFPHLICSGAQAQVGAVSPILWAGPQFLAVACYFLGALLGIVDICIGDSMSSGRMVCSIPVSTQ